MRYLLVSVASAVLALIALHAQTLDSGLRPLAGVWVIEDTGPGNLDCVAIEDDRVTLHTRGLDCGGSYQHLRIRIDPTARPQRFEFFAENDKPPALTGIYRVRGNTMTISFGDQHVPFPEGFGRRFLEFHQLESNRLKDIPFVAKLVSGLRRGW